MNKIRIAGKHYDLLRKHLYPGDEKEAVAIALCGRSIYNGNHTLLVQEIFLVPYDQCMVRSPDNVQWPTEVINPLLEKAASNGLAVLKIHCHPGAYDRFSGKDDHSDFHLFSSIHAWLNDEMPHASCIMLPDGKIFGRFFYADMVPQTIHQISIAGSDILNWYDTPSHIASEEAQRRNLQAFGKKTISMLNRMKIGVVGCSGTGSPVIEQLKRLGVGELVLVDPDYVDMVNLNRIIGTTLNDAKNRRMKVDVMKREIDLLPFGTRVKVYPTHLFLRDVVKELAECDLLFGGVDSAEGRHFMSLISSYYLSPYFDMGVKLLADGQGGIDGIYGTVHYIQPFHSSLWSRGQYDMETVVAESIKRTDQREFERNRYLAKIGESSPAVISINMQVASTAVNEFLARIHPYRNIDNREIDAIRVLFSDCTMFYEAYPDICPFFSNVAGKGDIEPLLNNIELSMDEKAAQMAVTPAR